MENKELAHRLNRIIGQLEGIKKKLNAEEEADCKITLQQLKAVINALKKFGEAYISQTMEECFNKKSKEDLKQELHSIVSSAFFL
jgi:DNA-binding FrmR family transcriptional regulator